MEIVHHLSIFLRTTSKYEKQAHLVLKITKPFFVRVSGTNHVLTESEQEFIWSYFCLEKNYRRNSYWQKLGTLPSKNDQYIIKIVNYLNQYASANVVVSFKDTTLIHDLLGRLRTYPNLISFSMNFIRTNTMDRMNNELVMGGTKS